MQIQQVNRVDAEKVFIIVKNVDGGGSITTGMGTNLCAAGASIDGVSAVRSATSTAGWVGFVGFANQDIAINAFGLVQNWGFVSSAQISGVGTSITVTAGDVLKPGAVAGTLFSSVAAETLSTQLYRFSYVATTQTISANPSWTSVVVRAL